MIIFDKLKAHLEDQKPFVVYRKPNSKKVNGLFLKNTELRYVDDFSESGFVFAPFDDTLKTILFPSAEASFFEENQKDLQVEFNDMQIPSNQKNKALHMHRVSQAIKTIENSDLHKVVITRPLDVQVKKFEVKKVLKRLLISYPSAFTYCWYHPKVGLWMGASPETLCKVENTTIVTVALAGTKPFKENSEPSWGKKEIDEQQMVTDFIVDALTDKVRNLQVGKVESIRAGKLWHLKTKIEGAIIEGIGLQSILQELHPTPAVCGLPKDNAKRFIQDVEGYNRKFYTGFLGELNIAEKTNTLRSHLFVNLRCLEAYKNNVVLYVGGGITADSDAQAEWEETVYKTQTMKRVL